MHCSSEIMNRARIRQLGRVCYRWCIVFYWSAAFLFILQGEGHLQLKVYALSITLWLKPLKSLKWPNIWGWQYTSKWQRSMGISIRYCHKTFGITGDVWYSMWPLAFNPVAWRLERKSNIFLCTVKIELDGVNWLSTQIGLFTRINFHNWACALEAENI